MSPSHSSFLVFPTPPSQGIQSSSTKRNSLGGSRRTEEPYHKLIMPDQRRSSSHKGRRPTISEKAVFAVPAPRGHQTAKSQASFLSITIPATMSFEKPLGNNPPTPREHQQSPLRDTFVAKEEFSGKCARQPSLPVRGAGPPGGFLSASMSKPREIAFNVMICFVQLVPQACLTTCFPSSTAIAKYFNITDPSVIPWMIAAYALTFGTFILVAGRLGDIFGHKRMVVIGFSFMAFWSVVAGLSHYASYEVFFVARAMQGIGSAMMNPNGLALLGRTYAPGSKQKILAFSLFGLCAPIGAYLGMIGGALFSELVQWYWTFYTLAILSALLACLAQLIFVAPPPSPKQLMPFSAKLREMDWLGAFTGVSGLVCVEVAFVCAPSQGWQTQYVYMLLIMGILLIAAFGIVETRLAKQPLAPFKILKSDVGFVLSAVGCGWAAFGIWSWYLWRFLLGVRLDSPLQACLHVLPIVPVALIASVVTAYLMRTTKPAWILIWALVAFTLGPALLSLVQPGQTYFLWIFISLLIMPWGMDMSLPSAMMMMSNAVPLDKQGVAGSLVATVVNYSISLGLGFAATADSEVARKTRDALAGIRAAWYVGAALGSLGAIITIIFLIKGMVHARRQTQLQQEQQQQASEKETRRRSTTVSSEATLTPSRERSYNGPSSLQLMSCTFDKDQELTALVGIAPLPPVPGQNGMPQELAPVHKRTGSWESFDIEECYNYERPLKLRGLGIDDDEELKPPPLIGNTF